MDNNRNQSQENINLQQEKIDGTPEKESLQKSPLSFQLTLRKSKKTLLLSLIVFILIIITSLTYVLKIKNHTIPFVIKKSKTLCNAGGALKFFGHDWIGDDIYLKCDCLGKTAHKSGTNCVDCDWVECDGDVRYSCHKLNVSKEDLSSMGEEYEAYILSHSTPISCPPNHWMGTTCKNDNDCSALGCKYGGEPTCKEWGCICH